MTNQGLSASLARKRRRFFNINGWPLAIISLVSIVRGLTYFGTSYNPDHRPIGLDAIGTYPALFAFYCTLWMLAGVLGLAASVTGRRRIALSMLVGLCVIWALGYGGQFVVDIFTHSIQSPTIYLGGLTYLGFGAALFRYPSKG